MRCNCRFWFDHQLHTKTRHIWHCHSEVHRPRSPDHIPHVTFLTCPDWTSFLTDPSSYPSCMDTPSLGEGQGKDMNRITHTTENITFPTTSYVVSNKLEFTSSDIATKIDTDLWQFYNFSQFNWLYFFHGLAAQNFVSRNWPLKSGFIFQIATWPRLANCPKHNSKKNSGIPINSNIRK